MSHSKKRNPEIQFPPHIRDSPKTLPLNIRSSSDIVPSLSVPIICRFHHRFRRFRHCLSFLSFAVSAAASIYHYCRDSKLSVLHRKLTQPLPLHLGSSFLPPTLKGHIHLIVVTTTSPAHTELALLTSKSFLT
jgi:hypothetical protein